MRVRVSVRVRVRVRLWVRVRVRTAPWSRRAWAAASAAAGSRRSSCAGWPATQPPTRPPAAVREVQQFSTCSSSSAPAAGGRDTAEIWPSHLLLERCGPSVRQVVGVLPRVWAELGLDPQLVARDTLPSARRVACSVHAVHPVRMRCACGVHPVRILRCARSVRTSERSPPQRGV